MKRLALVCVLLLVGNPVWAQSIFKGLEYGMTKKEAKAEWKANKNEYIHGIDLGNGFSYRTVKGYFQYKDDSLYAVLFDQTGHYRFDIAFDYLIATRAYYQGLGYDLFHEPDYWPSEWEESEYGSLTIDYKANYGLLMSDPGKKLMVQIYVADKGSYAAGVKYSMYITRVIIYIYDDFMQMWESGDTRSYITGLGD